MFTGIVESLGTVEQSVAEGPGRRLLIRAADVADDSKPGDSIAVNGVCLTLVEDSAANLGFQVGPETLARTNLGDLQPGDRVNLERSLLPTSRIGGHFVLGHVDGIAHIAGRSQEADWEWVGFAADPQLTAQMVPKGAVAVDGVSLTLVSVAPDSFQIMLIPHTLEHTTLGFKPVGARVNVETDILGKYVRRAVWVSEAEQ